MTALQWEHNWIDNNSHYYDSIEHAERVKVNIAKRYKRNALIAILRAKRPRILK